MKAEGAPEGMEGGARNRSADCPRAAGQLKWIYDNGIDPVEPC